MKKLYLMRHAKSDYPNNRIDDHERPLNKRGEISCKIMGKYIKEQNLIADRILCSDSVRTTTTAINILREIKEDIPIHFTKELYLATAGEMLKILAKTDDELNSVMIITHNPGIEQLAKFILKSGDAESIHRLQTKFSTAALACFSLDTDSWQKINPGSGNLDSFITPGMLE
jgi:phosphohistidine phosphatase